MIDKLFVQQWLAQARKGIKARLPMTDMPYGGKDVRDSKKLITGPQRSVAFRDLVQRVLHLPGMTNRPISNAPCLYQQQYRKWGQYDGSIQDPIGRSVLAALGAGATYDNLLVPEIADNVVKAVNYTMTLAGPKYAELFKAQGASVDAEQARRGASVYMTHCDSCHGHPGEDGSWIAGQQQGEVVTAEDIGTDAERVEFRFVEKLPEAIYDDFPDGHPFRPKREDLRASPGYINAPIEAAFTRAGYLHNGAVITLAELINLKPRRDVFYRGDNLYDMDDLGLASPTQADVRHYYKFDTSEPGNSNQGHNYPWSFKGQGWNEAALRDLLEYLKTL